MTASAEGPKTWVGEDGRRISTDSSGFVLLSEAVPDAFLDIRYYSTYNFVGDRIAGYEEPLALLTKEAARALKDASDRFVSMGYRIKVFDAYRPQTAVDHFKAWAEDADDTRMKEYFYPDLDKSRLFELGYIAEHSSHCRGSAVDITLFDMAKDKDVDMGSTFDFFGEGSHPDYTGVTEEQYAMRMLLRDVMMCHGFTPIAEEWWHFALADEPYPETYFTFPVNSDSVEAMKAANAEGVEPPRLHLFDEIPTIEGERIILRPLEDGDAEALGELATDSEVNRYLPTFLFEKQYDDMHRAIREVYGTVFAERQSLILGIVERGEEHICGLAEFYGLRQDAGKVSIGYRLLQGAWGRGIATQTVDFMLGYLFGRTDIRLVTASTLPGNAASARVLEKSGFILAEELAPEDWGFEAPLPTNKWRLTKPC